METNLTIRARFFSHFPVETRKVIVEDDGTIRVWDDVAGHYTVCHSLTRSDQRRIRKLARESRKQDADGARYGGLYCAPEETEMPPVIHISESYAGKYRLEYLGNGWKRLFMNGKEVGAFLGRGGVYAAATFFNV